MKKVLLGLLMATLVWAQDPAALVHQANLAMQPGGAGLDTAIDLLKQANVLGADGKSLRDRAFTIRAQRVAGMSNPAAALQESYPIGGGVTPPRPLKHIEPEYSDTARQLLCSGTLLMSVVVGTDGLPHEMKLLSSLGYGLDEKAAEAVNAWRFQPGAKDGVPVAVQTKIEVNFRLL